MFNAQIISSIIKITTNKLYVYPGGTIAPLLHECKLDKVELFVSKSEQGAGYMAIAEALSTHKPAFVTVTSGPGATNIITCIADAYYDSIPLVILTGQVGTADLARSKKLRQRGFQEVPIADMVKDITKKVFQPINVQELSDAIHAAYQISNSNRKGPVLIDMPMDIQLGLLEENELEKYLNFDSLSTKNTSYDIDENLIEESISLLNKAEKPLVLVGAGAQVDYKKIREFVENSSLPVISSLRGIGIISDENYKGWIGHTGMPWANKSLYEADTILVLGSRLDVRQTGTQTNVLDDKTLIHVDVDELELEECRIKNTIKINMPIESYLEHINKKVNTLDISSWLPNM